MHTKRILFLIILFVGCLGQFASDIYSPAIPAISVALKTQINLVQMSMALYMLGMALSLLVYGPLSEGFGRKSPLLIGLSIFIVGSVLCLFAPTIHALIVGRFIQGLGVGACAGLWRSIFRDVFAGVELAKYGSYLSMLVTFVIPAAPMVGSNLLHFVGWRSIFAFLLLYAVITGLIVIFLLQETSRHHHKKRLKPSFIFANYKTLFGNKIFLITTSCIFLSYGAFFSWFAVGPVLLIHRIGLSVLAFGWFSFLGGGAAFMLAGIINGKLVGRFGIERMMRFGWCVVLLAGFLMVVGYFFFGVELWSILLPAVLFFLGSTFLWPNAFAMAMTPFGDIAGYAGTSYSFMQLSGGAVIGALVAHLPDSSQVPLGLLFMSTALISLLLFKFLPKQASD